MMSAIKDTDSSTLFLEQGANEYRPTAKDNLKIYEKLPPGNYNIGADDQGFFLNKVEDFQVSGKIYGDLLAQKDRIMSTFIDRPASTGVLLSGEKGSGKTLLTRIIATHAATLGYPTILINSVLKGESFNQFLQRIEQPTVIIFYEYEKVLVTRTSS